MQFIEYHGWCSASDVSLDGPSRWISDPVHDEWTGDSEQLAARPSTSPRRISALERLEILGWDEV